MHLFQALLLLSATHSASGQLNLFSNGATGPLLGTSFGLPANSTFDYVVVGAGPAGLTVATKLAESGNFSVAVIEAGGFYEVDNGNLSVVPYGSLTYSSSDPTIPVNPLVDWGFLTTPQEQLGGLVVHYTRGKTLGGTSGRNYMLYHRPTNGSLDKWAQEVGDDSFRPENFFPYYKKSVNITDNRQAFTEANVANEQDLAAFEPRGGPLQASFAAYIPSLVGWVAQAFSAVGLAPTAGMINGELLGYGYGPSCIEPGNGHRSSAESSFLQTALQNGRSPTIYKNTQAQKILFNPNKSATGVECLMPGTFGTPSLPFTLHARREVIVSAGVFHSPQLLMVSGVGNGTELARLGIDTVSDLPGVGQNLQDSPNFGPVSHALNLHDEDPDSPQAVEQYLNNGTGPLAIFPSSPLGWEKLPEPFRSNLSAASRQALDDPDFVPADWPELEYLPTSALVNGTNIGTIQSSLIASLSRGSVTLRSNNMSELPLINVNWLSSPVDHELAVQAVKRERQMWDFLVQQGIAAPEELTPGANVTTDEQILQFVMQSANGAHAAATCKMGRRNDSMAVVDSRGRVFGVQGLRVVDASGFPFLPTGHPLATIYAFAGMVAEEILGGN